MTAIWNIEGPHGSLELATVGPDDGRPVIIHHGTPGAAHPSYPPLDEVAIQRGWRQICYSRPGYGGSVRHVGRTVADCAADVRAIADALGIDRFHTIGGSGGGPHVLATAALLGDRVIAAASIAGIAPWAAERLDWLAGMGPENVDEFRAALAGEAPLREYLDPVRTGMLQATADDVYELLDGLLCDIDRATLTGPYAEQAVLAMKTALASGVDGWVDDDLAFSWPWGFELASIEVPVTVWQGARDQFVPAAHGDWLIEHVPNAQPKRLPEHGHLSIAVGLYGEILDELLSAGG
ncbi:MAG: alpha/beta hydrolase [Solirubrobacteraceae bacterium]